MFSKIRHQRIATILQALDSDLLVEAECYFAGGTAIALSLAEYRESLDIDFLCASMAGYRLLRNTVTNIDLGALLTVPLTVVRDIHTDRNAIRTFIEVDGDAIKIEFVREDRIVLQGHYDPVLGVPKLCMDDMYAEKLLANADRGRDKFVKSRDIIDLAMMIDCWGDIPKTALEKSHAAYGDHVFKALESSLELIKDKVYFRSCLKAVHMDEGMADPMCKTIEDQIRLIKRSRDNSLEP